MSLDNAMRAFIRNGGDRTVMLIPLWATTYNVEPDAVRESWERLMSEHSLKPINAFDETGEGK